MSEFPQAPDVKEKRNNTPIIIIVIGAILLLFLCCCAAVFGANALFRARGVERGFPLFGRGVDIAREIAPFGQVEAAQTIEETVTDIDTPVTIEVDNHVGEVRIIGADIDTVQVEALVRAWGSNETQAQENLDRVRVTVDSVAGDHVRVTGSFPQNINPQRSPSVQLTVRVPRDAMVDASTNVGEVHVENVNGDVSVRTNVGEIGVEDVVGALHLTTDVGDILVDDWTMTGDSRLESNVGRLRVGLHDAAFSLDAQTNVGNIETEFDVDGDEERRVPGERLTGPVGENPEMDLVLRAGTGEITLDRID
jgi:hypothetical protein